MFRCRKHVDIEEQCSKLINFQSHGAKKEKISKKKTYLTTSKLKLLKNPWLKNGYRQKKNP